MTVRARSGPASIASQRRIGATTDGRQQPLVRSQVRARRTAATPAARAPRSRSEQVTAHRRQRRRRDPVEHHRDRRTALDGALQHPPRQRVAVPGGGRHEEPQVRRLEQPVRRLAVRLQHRVEVRGVQQRDPARHLLVGDDASPTPGPGGARAAPSSSGLCTSTGRRVVGRSTPAVLTSEPTNEFTSVDLPAPVEPETTTTAGAESSVRRGTRCSPSWSTSRARDARADLDPRRSPAGTRCARRRGAGPGPRRAATSPRAAARGRRAGRRRRGAACAASGCAYGTGCTGAVPGCALTRPLSRCDLTWQNAPRGAVRVRFVAGAAGTPVRLAD